MFVNRRFPRQRDKDVAEVVVHVWGLFYSVALYVNDVRVDWERGMMPWRTMANDVEDVIVMDGEGFRAEVTFDEHTARCCWLHAHAGHGEGSRTV